MVGTVLSGANQGSIIASGHPNWATWTRVAVNYLTPFVVASLGYLAGCRVQPPATETLPASRMHEAYRLPQAETVDPTGSGHSDEGQV